jgi:hypothetical protein
MRKILYLLFIVFIYYGCEKQEKDIKGELIYLIAIDDPVILKKSIVLFDDQNYTIKTAVDTFIVGYPFNVLYGYEDMRVKAIYDSAYSDILNVSDYMKYNNDSIYTLAYYLENGNCFILDKTKNVGITTISMETYITGEPMASTGGRRFYIKNKLFLETVDMISK